MYILRQGKIFALRANTKKTIRLDDMTVNIINSVEGRNFSEKVRNMAYEYSRFLQEKSKTKFLQ